MSTVDISVTAIIVLIISAAVWKIVRDKKKGKGSCSCAGCPVAGQCEGVNRKTLENL